MLGRALRMLPSYNHLSTAESFDRTDKPLNPDRDSRIRHPATPHTSTHPIAADVDEPHHDHCRTHFLLLELGAPHLLPIDWL